MSDETLEVSVAEPPHTLGTFTAGHGAQSPGLALWRRAVWEGRWFFMAARALVLLVWRCLWISSLLSSHLFPCHLS